MNPLVEGLRDKGGDVRVEGVNASGMMEAPRAMDVILTSLPDEAEYGVRHRPRWMLAVLPLVQGAAFAERIVRFAVPSASAQLRCWSRETWEGTDELAVTLLCCSVAIPAKSNIPDLSR